ncbi:hypothetical protein [Capnocytophaga canis]|uniref:hypothetical protein n=1 Tax=Capnocytophaga canis TaxID=1848903 RepID=UPI001562953C|nr:hypothetical protein [Capnocytophaga canis]
MNKYFLHTLLLITFVPACSFIISYFCESITNELISLIINYCILLATLSIPYIVNTYKIKKDSINDKETKIRGYLELFQYFVSTEFREKRRNAWKVFVICLKNKEYTDFIFERTYGNFSKFSDKDIKEKFYKLYTPYDIDSDQFISKENEYRHHLIDVISFFKLAAVKDVPDDNVLLFDFYYDWWRPMLCWFAYREEQAYNTIQDSEIYYNTPSLKNAIESLDKKYYNPKNNIFYDKNRNIKPDKTIDSIIIETLKSHPIIKLNQDI